MKLPELHVEVSAFHRRAAAYFYEDEIDADFLRWWSSASAPELQAFLGKPALPSVETQILAIGHRLLAEALDRGQIWQRPDGKWTARHE
jgi:hypothetical protein